MDSDDCTIETSEEDEAPAASPEAEAQAVIGEAMRMIVKQIPQQVTAAEIMTKSVTSLLPGDTMNHAIALMQRMRKRALPVLESEDGKLIGFLKYSDPIRALQSGKGDQQVKAWTRRELLRVKSETPMAELEAMLIGGSTGRLHVVDDEGRLIGLVTRTDMLRHSKHYVHMQRRVA